MTPITDVSLPLPSALTGEVRAAPGGHSQGSLLDNTLRASLPGPEASSQPTKQDGPFLILLWLTVLIYLGLLTAGHECDRACRGRTRRPQSLVTPLPTGWNPAASWGPGSSL